MRGKAEKKGMLFGGLNSMFFECVLRHYHPLLFLHIWLSTRNVFPLPVLDDMGHLTGTAHAGKAWSDDLRLRAFEGQVLLNLNFRKVAFSH